MTKIDRNSDDKSSAEPPSKKSKYSLPTLDEQSQLNTTELVLNTNLFSLQVSEILDEVKLNRKAGAIKALDSLIELIQKTLSSSKFANKEISSDWLAKKGIKDISLISYSLNPVSIVYQAPSAVEVIGSYPIQTTTSPLVNVDISVTMNKECFEERDILNYVYFDKRTLYIAVLYHLLQQSVDKNEILGDVSFSLFKGDIKKPIVVMMPKLPGWKNLVIRIIPILPTTVFKIVQLNPLKNNVRPKEWLESLKNASDSTNSHLDASSLDPTPSYNNSIAEDIAISTHQKIIQSVTNISSVAKQIIVLLKIWLTQRQLRYGLDVLDSHSAAILVAYLFQTKRIAPSMSPATGFQSVMRFLAELKIPSVLNFGNTDLLDTSESATEDRVSLLHPIGNREKFIEYDAFWRISKSTWSIIKSDAESSRLAIQKFDESTFNRLFLSKISILDREDILFHVSVPRETALSLALPGSDKNLVEPLWQYLVKQIYSDLTVALNDRISSLVVRAVASSSDYINSLSSIDQYYLSHPHTCGDSDFVITIGLTLVLEKSIRKVDRGPTYENAEELQIFRDFWGSKCQLRRFQDGSIVEAVVWDVKSWINPKAESTNQTMRGALIVGEIIRYVLGKNYPNICGVHGENVSSLSLALEESLHSKSLAASSATADITVACRSVIEALDSLRTILASKIVGMPIMIESLQGLDPELRYTSTYAPLPHPLLRGKNGVDSLNEVQGKKLSMLVKPVLLLGTLESSGKWPTDQEAVAKLKAGILLKAYELLKEQFSVSSIVHEDSIDIIFEGFLFRMVILSDKETLQAASYVPSRPILDNLHPCSLTRMSAHHLAVRALVASFPCYADTVRYTVEWLNQSYLTGLISHSVIELIVAKAFLDPFPKSQCPSSATIAFLHVLKLLVSFEWKTTPLILNVDQSITPTDVEAIKASFESYRLHCQSTGHMKLPIYVVASYDRIRNFTPVLWDYELSGSELGIIVKSAQQSYQLLENRLNCADTDISSSLSLKSICSLAEQLVLDKCNIVLKFHPDISKLHSTTSGPAPTYATLQTFKNTPIRKLSTHNLIARWSSTKIFPIQEEIVQSLRNNFGKHALFFWNGMEGSDIAVTWKPSAFLPKKLSILEAANRAPLPSESKDGSSSDLTVTNTLEIVASIISHCDGYVTSFEFL